jgi:hypothetical protein
MLEVSMDVYWTQVVSSAGDKSCGHRYRIADQSTIESAGRVPARASRAIFKAGELGHSQIQLGRLRVQ